MSVDPVKFTACNCTKNSPSCFLLFISYATIWEEGVSGTNGADGLQGRNGVGYGSDGDHGQLAGLGNLREIVYIS